MMDFIHARTDTDAFLFIIGHHNQPRSALDAYNITHINTHIGDDVGPRHTMTYIFLRETMYW